MEIVTKELTIGGEGLRVHAISTGMVSVKKKFRETSQKGIFAILSFLVDRQFTEWMPIWTWVIEHPEDIYLIDTGENSNVSDKDYFKTSGYFANWLNTTQFKFKVEREEEIDIQLKKIGLSADMVNRVILTHLHLDHTDGLKHFPENEILINKQEWDKPFGDLPKLYPSWFNPTKIVLDEAFQTFDQAKPITNNKDMIMIQTDGHTYGNSSVLLKTDEGYLMFVGDMVYYEQQLLLDKFAGGNVSFKKAKKSYLKIREFAMQNKLVVLPTHDIEAANRLSKMKTLLPSVRSTWTA